MTALVFLVLAFLRLSVADFDFNSVSDDQAFDPLNFELQLHVEFSDNSFTIRGQAEDIKGHVNSGADGQTGLTEDGLELGYDLPGYFSIPGVDIRHSTAFFRNYEYGEDFYPAEHQGHVFLTEVSWEETSNLCTYCRWPSSMADIEEGVEMADFTCPTDIEDDYLLVPETYQTIFSLNVDGIPSNLLFQVKRSRASSDLIDPNNLWCTKDELIYEFIVTLADDTVVYWPIHAWRQIWLEDGEPHKILLVWPRTYDARYDDGGDGIRNAHWPLLYIDGQFICTGVDNAWNNLKVAAVYCADDRLSGEDFESYPGEDYNQNLAYPEEVYLDTCWATTLMLGQHVDEWFVMDPHNDQSEGVTVLRETGLSGATFHHFWIWAYVGIPLADEPTFCPIENRDACYTYSGRPFCLNSDDGSEEYETLGLGWDNLLSLGEDVSCVHYEYCGCGDFAEDCDSDIENECGVCGYSCSEGEKCNNYNECIPVEECCDACSFPLECCDGDCVSTFNDDHCNTCDNVCAEDHSCCETYGSDLGKGEACEGTFYHCSECGDQCDDGWDCCDDDCRDLSEDFDYCGSCGVDCDDGDYDDCCDGFCSYLEDNFNCGSCGNKCDGEREACCEEYEDGLGCISMDSQEHCGSCQNNCTFNGEQDNTTYACCEGQCRELFETADNCGRCGDNCYQIMDDETAECCVDEGLNALCWVPFSDESCLSCGEDCTTNEFDTTCCGEDGCVDTDTDTDHCGECFNECTEDAPICCFGECVNVQCDDDLIPDLGPVVDPPLPTVPPV